MQLWSRHPKWVGLKTYRVPAFVENDGPRKGNTLVWGESERTVGSSSYVLGIICIFKII